MDIKFDNGGEENTQAEPAAEKKKQSALLVLLLILVGGFSYIYFFTGIIKPQDTPKPAEAPVAQVVKMPLPPRDGDAAKADAKPADAKKDVAAPAKAEPAQVAAATPPAKVVTPPPAKPKEEPKKVEPAKPKEEPKKAEPVKPKVEPKKADPAKAAEKKPVVTDKKPAAAEKKVEPAKSDVKKVAAEAAPKQKAPSPKPEKTAKPQASSGTAWAILVGTYTLEDVLSADMGRVRKAGFEPVVKPGTRKKSAMNRLYFSEFADRGAAQAALDKLKRHTSDAFIVDHSGRHVVYAGSYLLNERAASEMERLSAAGFKVTLKRAEVSIPTQSLFLGPFADRKAADAALVKLKAAGVKASISRQ